MAGLAPIDMITGGVVAAALFGYLLVALLAPERF
jgi:K+-transporting ATPase KdpF subunit